MPIFLSFFLTLCAVAWFFYGLLIKDIYVMLPNVLGFIFGMAQMILYIIYKKPKNAISDEKMKNASLNKEPELEEVKMMDEITIAG
ncbi:hypothetical protein HPP92_006991 [Vanilla planifolia]|uniref:Uncharacterized protein n=1 Tax=Vanilla planifolia TaxID=51239 RepID=A0A835RKZ4_VANPL|nr:hypothetical protein HPP92_006989 [Vanilla planifolia]KAG0488180.1 hypothetical protein HPP92_006991 [Vanilla planifolia]